MSSWMLIPLLIPLIFFGFMVLLGLCERRFLSGDVEPTTDPGRLNPYWDACNFEAAQLGLIPGGVFATCKDASLVKGFESLYLTPDREILVSIVSASSLKKITLYSRLGNGQMLESSDTILMDYSGLIQGQLLHNAGLSELIDFHCHRLDNAEVEPEVFPEQDQLSLLEAWNQEKGRRSVQQRRAYWVNPQCTQIRLTLSGAVSVATAPFNPKNYQFSRQSLPRPGDAGYRISAQGTQAKWPFQEFDKER